MRRPAGRGRGSCPGFAAHRRPDDPHAGAPILAPMARRLRFRPPGLKPTTKIGTLGPYRGRLGLAWVVAPIVAGAIILVAGYVALVR